MIVPAIGRVECVQKGILSYCQGVMMPPEGSYREGWTELLSMKAANNMQNKSKINWSE